MSSSTTRILGADERGGCARARRRLPFMASRRLPRKDEAAALLQRQAEGEDRSSARPVGRPDASAMSLDDGPGDGQPQPGAAAAALGGGASVELLEDLLLARPRPAPVPGRRPRRPRRRHRPCAEMSMGEPAGEYLSALSSRLKSTCSISTPSRGTRGRSAGMCLVIVPAGGLLPQPAESRADDVLEREPLLVDHGDARLQPGHAQQVLDQPGETVRLVVDLGEERARAWRCRPRRPSRAACWSCRR